jgi:hypothetical protein
MYIRLAVKAATAANTMSPLPVELPSSLVFCTPVSQTLCMTNSNTAATQNLATATIGPFSTGTPRNTAHPSHSLCFFFLPTKRLANFYNIIPSTTRLRDRMTA